MRAVGEAAESMPWRDIKFDMAMRSSGWWLKGVLLDPGVFCKRAWGSDTLERMSGWWTSWVRLWSFAGSVKRKARKSFCW